ncbi:flagellar hook-length control protein FliK [Stutzerimonas nosocomialis]|uniref:Flagellar hook-length control protein FliK n=1 Tax=Stutzerimonas nosocomialis TaxID=1056496 RepID=A0A5R9R2N7_9GAMM|nr:flagellar hook-length control protein FliK [Stutzerimonas nosocomialis]TLX64745.1 flagellar hook-length control protein FliK [Stutzerimonas nosocomialis]
MTEIKAAQPLPAAPPRSAAAAADLALKLLQPMQGLLAAGESAEAEVVSVKESGQAFQLILRLTLDNGRQTTLEALSNRAVATGTAYAVTALSDNRLMASLQALARQPTGSIDLDRVPIGTILQGKVVASQQIAAAKGEHAVFKMVVQLLNTAMANEKLEIESTTPLPLGTLLTAQVKGSQALSFLPLSGRLDQLALGQQMAAQQERQASLEGLLGALRNAGSLPEGLKGAAEKLLGLMPEVSELTDPKALAQALEKSGTLLEARLLAGQHGAAQGDMKAALLRLIAQLLPSLPGSTPFASAQAGAAMGQALPAFARHALGVFGQNGARQQAMGFPLPSRLLQGMDEEADLETLLKLAAAAVSRLQTHQLSSLAQSQVGPEGTLLTTWQMEIPMRDQRDIVPLQVKLQREESPPEQRKEKQEIVWRVELAFDLSPLGPLQVQAQLAQGNLSSQLWAERASTAHLINGELDHLRDRLVAAGLAVGELACRQGTPPQGPKTSLEQRFVDETA